MDIVKSFARLANRMLKQPTFTLKAGYGHDIHQRSRVATIRQEERRKDPPGAPAVELS